MPKKTYDLDVLKKRLKQKPKLTPEEIEAARARLREIIRPKRPIQMGEIGRHQIDF